MARGRPTRSSRGASSSAQGPKRGRGKSAAKRDDGIPDVYRGLLEEAAQTESLDSQEPQRASKRRRVGEDVTPAEQSAEVKQDVEIPPISPGSSDSALEVDQTAELAVDPPRQQMIIEESDDSDDSDMEWEDVDVNTALFIPSPEPEPQQEDGSITVVIGKENPSSKLKRTPQRKGITAVERRMRYDVHKLHLLCLLSHMHIRNHLCNSATVQRTLRPLLTTKIIKALNPESSLSQFQRHQYFTGGLSDVAGLWKDIYKVTKPGNIRRCFWAKDAEEVKKVKPQLHTESSINQSRIESAATSLHDSADIGAILFCALLRSAGVDARLVCSLQVLPPAIGTQGANSPTAKKAQKRTVYVGTSSDEHEQSSDDDLERKNLISSTSPVDKSLMRNPRRRLGGASFMNPAAFLDQGKPPPRRTEKKLKLIPPPTYPLFWVEAFDHAHQKWVPLDPICTKTVGKAFRFEPPQNDMENQMAYVIAFEEDGVARDVTRRYAKAYNAKTRRYRIESIEGGHKWWKKTMRIYKRRGGRLDREQVEDAELTKKEAGEGIPRNVQDFKGHPFYVLERNLKKSEVIHPKKEVGKVNIGTAASGKTEPVYRRKDVHTVRSADRWFRLGREIKQGEQPLKFAVRKRNKLNDADDQPAEEETEEEFGAGLYAFFQTKLYIPPPVVNGRVPRNSYGNLDIYVPSMIPAGGAHVTHLLAARACRLLGVDYADAVIGFDFKGRVGTAVVKGIIVAAENAEAVQETIHGLETAQEEVENSKRTAATLRMWKRFLIGLRIVERIKTYGETDEQEDIRNEIDDHEDEQAEADSGGGFLPDFGQDESAQATAARRDDEDMGGGFLASVSLPESDDSQRQTSHTAIRRKRMTTSITYAPEIYSSAALEEGGGFIPDGRDIIEDQNEVKMAQNTTSTIDDTRGGFIVEPFSNDHTTQVELSMSGALPHDEPENDQGGGFLVDSEEPNIMQDARVDHQMADFEDNSQQRRGSSKRLQQADESPRSDDDRNSLLSHDPEDDDAEPEWLQDVDSD